MPTANRRIFVFLSACLVTTMVAASAQKPADNNKLNVLFIMTDQHNVRALGCYGSKEVKTPNLDRLAAHGVLFSNAFTQTGQCCPARYTIWTGRYAHSHGVRWNGVVEPLEETTVVEIFKKAGYETACFGKHHMIHYPIQHGFDEVLDWRDYGQWIIKNKIPNFKKHGDFLPGVLVGGSPVGVTHVTNDQALPGYMTAQTLRFIGQNKNKPFFIHYSFEGPHTPYTPSMPWAKMYDPDKLILPGNFNYKNESAPAIIKHLQQRYTHMTEQDHRKTLAYYYGLITQIDYNIGRVLDEIDRFGLADRTIVVFTTDHGDMATERRCWTKPACGHEATIHIPMIMRLPGVIPAGVVREQLVGLIDLMPTLCDLADFEIPDKVQGKSLVPIMQGKSVEWRKVIFSEVGYPGHTWGRVVTARTRRHKYVNHENAPVGKPVEEFFDLTNDPWEVKNEINNPRYLDIVNRLKKEIKRWEETTDHAPMYPIGEMKLEPRPKQHNM
ncbi:MAG: sulfatase-like hydrolase/transferase [Planctomycetota bacterium]|nr:MAG: sulfatase-like hydrolase/transferase [Planctomycetota bacterium]